MRRVLVGKVAKPLYNTSPKASSRLLRMVLTTLLASIFKYTLYNNLGLKLK